MGRSITSDEAVVTIKLKKPQTTQEDDNDNTTILKVEIKKLKAEVE